MGQPVSHNSGRTALHFASRPSATVPDGARAVAHETLAVTEGETDAGNHETEPVKNSS